jgi:hypothetical protein
VSACCRASSGLLYRQPLLVQLATRMQFLSDFDDLLAASGKASDPKSLQSDPLFSLENRRSLLALAFLIASSHSLRDVVVANEQCHLGYETKTGPVFVPFMHMLEQAQDPNCEVRYEDGKFVLFARKHIYPSNKLQIAYPQVSYDELMYDCGLKARPDMDCNDVGIFLEKNSLNAARAVVQQIDLERFAASQYCSGGGPSSGAAHSKQSKQSGKLDKNAVQRLISHLSAPLYKSHLLAVETTVVAEGYANNSDVDRVTVRFSWGASRLQITGMRTSLVPRLVVKSIPCFFFAW